MSARLKESTLNVGGFLDEFEKDQVKRDVDILSLFSSFGVKLERKGNSYMGLCPFHDDKNPSLSVDKAKGLFHCFGCGASGDVFDLVMKLKGMDFKEALAYLKVPLAAYVETPSPVRVTDVQQPAETLPEPEEPAPGASVESVLDTTLGSSVLEKANLDDLVSYYEKNLAGNTKAQNYLKTRGLLDWDLLKRFRIGFSDGSLKGRLSEAQYSEFRDRGIFQPKGQETFVSYIVFPLLDEQDRPVSLYGRKIVDRSSLPAHRYLKGPHSGLLNGKAFGVYKDRMILSESVIDALSLMALGFQNVCPVYGTNGVTGDHFRMIEENRTKEIIIAFDNDEAGRKASEELAGRLLSLDTSVRVVSPPETVSDWNEALLASSLKQEIEALIEAAPLRKPESLEYRSGVQVEEREGKYFFTVGSILYRLIGVKEGFVSSLKVNIRAEKDGEKHIDNVDLFSARSRSSFAYALSRIFEVEAARVERDLISLLEWLERDRDRKLSDPISIIVISQSAVGKSYLIDTVKKLIPPEDVLSMTSLSDQALNYLPEEALLHKFLIMGEAVHSDAVDHQMREMLSAQELSRLVTTKDEKTGKMTSRLVRKKAVVSAVMSSATGDINPENASRCFVISTDETEEQTRAIHREQRRKYSLARIREKQEALPSIVKAHHAAQRLLKDVVIINPFADYLDFPASLMRSRRDHERFIDLIASVCYLRQYQKPEQKGGLSPLIECDLEDYKVAYDIMVKILPSTLSNFPKSAQLLYETIRRILKEKADQESLPISEVSVTQREIREREGLEHNFVKRNIRLLVEYEYLNQKGGQSRGGKAFYRINQDGPLSLFDLSSIPKPEEVKELVKSGSRPLTHFYLKRVKELGESGSGYGERYTERKGFQGVFGRGKGPGTDGAEPFRGTLPGSPVLPLSGRGEKGKYPHRRDQGGRRLPGLASEKEDSGGEDLFRPDGELLLYRRRFLL